MGFSAIDRVPSLWIGPGLNLSMGTRSARASLGNLDRNAYPLQDMTRDYTPPPTIVENNDFSPLPQWGVLFQARDYSQTLYFPRDSSAPWIGWRPMTLQTSVRLPFVRVDTIFNLLAPSSFFRHLPIDEYNDGRGPGDEADQNWYVSPLYLIIVFFTCAGLARIAGCTGHTLLRMQTLLPEPFLASDVRLNLWEED